MSALPPHAARAAWGLAALALAALALFGWRGRAPERPSAAAEDALLAELRLLRASQVRTAEALEGLERRLPALLERPPVAAAPAAARTPAEDGDPGFDASVEALVRGLDALRLTLERESSATRELVRAAELDGERLVELRAERLEPDWNLLGSLEREWRFDRARASRSQHFQTPRDLLRTYGPPSAIYRPQRGGLQFVYRAHPEGGSGTAWYFQVQEGFVVEFFVEDEQR